MDRIHLRRIGLAAAALVLVALAGLTALRVHGSMVLDDAVERFEAAVGPLEFEAYRPAPVPDRENAALPLLRAVERLEERPAEESWREEMGALKQSNRLAAGAWSAEDVARARELVASRPEVLALLHRAAGRSGSSYRLDYTAGPEMEIPNLLLHLQGAELLFAEARLAWLDGRPGDAVRSVEALAALARALETAARDLGRGTRALRPPPPLRGGRGDDGLFGPRGRALRRSPRGDPGLLRALAAPLAVGRLDRRRAGLLLERRRGLPRRSLC